MNPIVSRTIRNIRSDPFLCSHPYDTDVTKSFYYDPEILVEPGSASGPPTPVQLNLTEKVAIVCGNGNPQLAKEVTSLLRLDLHAVNVIEYKCGEINVKYVDPVGGKDVYIIQSTCGTDDIDVNESIFELLFLIRRARQGRAARITAIIPFLAYSRQVRKIDLRVPLSACALARMITAMEVDRIVTVDLHVGQIQGYFLNVPVDNLTMTHEFAQYIRRKSWFVPEKCVVVSPDAGGVERARTLANILDVHHVATIIKRAQKDKKGDSMHFVGDVTGFTCIIMDDIVDTGATLNKAAILLRQKGAKNVLACCTHAILTEPSCSEIMECDAISEFIVSDSIPQDGHARRCSKLTVLPTAPLIAMALIQLTNEKSVGSLLQGPVDKEELKRLIEVKKINKNE